MLEIRHVSHAVGGRALLARVSLVVHPRDRIGVIGPNGSGKSTLLRIAAGELVPDTGRVVRRASASVLSLPQSIEAPPGVRVGARFPHLLAGPGLAAAGVGDATVHTPLSTLSGGELMRLAITDALAARPDVLLLDEPTNHLDLAGMRWLEARLQAFPGAVVAVSHDPAFLDAVAEQLLVLGGAHGAVEAFAGTYRAWTHERERRAEEQRLAFGRQQRDERRLRDHIAQIESRSRHIEASTINFAIRKKAKKIARRSTTLKRRLEREATAVERVARPATPPRAFIDRTATASRSGGRLVDLDGVEVRAGERVLCRGVTVRLHAGDRIALVGGNGSGKSTLLRLLGGSEPVGRGIVRLAPTVRMGFLVQGEAFADRLRESPADVLRRGGGLTEVDARNLLHRVVGPAATTHARLGDLSYGERRRLALALLVAQGAHLLLLDEPTNHLDLDAREALTSVLATFEGAMLFATHDRRLIATLATRVWSIEEGRVTERTVEDVVDGVA